jgi:hypothetical protein
VPVKVGCENVGGFPFRFFLTTFASVKRISVTIVALIYLAITSGILVNVHYCMGEVATVDYGHTSASACAECGMEEKEGCCSTKTAFVKVSEQHKAPSIHLEKNGTSDLLIHNHGFYSDDQVAYRINVFPKPSSVYHPPSPPLTILYNNFRI